MFKLLVITLVFATVVVAADTNATQEKPRYDASSTARPTQDKTRLVSSSTVRPNGPAQSKLTGLNQSSYLQGQDSPAKDQSARQSSGSKSSPSRQGSQQSSLDNLGGQFSPQRGQQARPSQQKQTNNVDFDGQF